MFGKAQGVTSDPEVQSDRPGEILTVVLMVVSANLADLASTYLACRDLSLEGNPLFSGSPRYWVGAVFAKILVSALAIGLHGYHVRHRRRCYPRHPMDRGSFIRYFMLGRQVGWLRFLIAPAKPRHALCWVGGVFGIASSVYYTLLSLNNLAIHFMNCTFDLPVGPHALSGYTLTRLLQMAVSLGIAWAWMMRGTYADYLATREQPETSVRSCPRLQERGTGRGLSRPVCPPAPG